MLQLYGTLWLVAPEPVPSKFDLILVTYDDYLVKDIIVRTTFVIEVWFFNS